MVVPTNQRPELYTHEKVVVADSVTYVLAQEFVGSAARQRAQESGVASAAEEAALVPLASAVSRVRLVAVHHRTVRLGCA